MAHTSETRIKTAKASGYLQQLCKHFGHKAETSFTPEAGSISFAFGTARLAADATHLTMTAEAEGSEDLERLKTVLASHLERFAFREALTITWA
jgi:hypothetical protein